MGVEVTKHWRAIFVAGAKAHARWVNGIQVAGPTNIPISVIESEAKAGMYDTEILKSISRLEWIESQAAFAISSKTTKTQFPMGDRSKPLSEKELSSALKRYRGNRTQVAKALKIQTKSVHKLMTVYGLEEEFPSNRGRRPIALP
jgi:DNA-binding NtrC family response regulator